jgi:hypothetical protein
MHYNDMTQQTTNTTPQEPTLVGVQSALEIVFPDPAARPSIRVWNEWRAKGYYSYLKIGKRVYINPVNARKEIAKRFTIEAIV